MQGVLKEISFITISSFFGQLISLFLVFYVASALGSIAFGELSYLLSIIILFPVISGFGVPNAIFRFYNTLDNENENEKKIILSTGFFFVFFSSLLLCIIIYLILGFIQLDIIFDYRLICCLYGFILSLTSVLNVILRSKRDYKQTSLISVSQPIIKSALVLCTIFFLKLSVSSLLIVNIICESIILFYIIRKLEERIHLNHFSLARLISLMRYGISFVPHRIVSKGQDPLIKSFILSFFGKEYVGLYALAQKVNLPFSFIIDKIQFIWGPLKFDIKRNIEDPKYYFQKIAQGYISLISLVAITYIFFILAIEYFDLYKPYPGFEFLALILVLITFLRSNYYMYATGIEFGKNMYMLPFSSIGYVVIIFLCYKFIPFFSGSIFNLMIPIVIAELYSIVLMRYYSNRIFAVKINFTTYSTTIAFALLGVVFCLERDVRYVMFLLVVSLISIFVNRYSIKISKELLANKL